MSVSPSTPLHCISHLSHHVIPDVALITALYLAAYNVGSAIGGAISGAIWTNTLPEKLEAYLNNSTLAAEVYESPFVFEAAYPVGTAERTAVIHAYNAVQRLLCITGVCLCVPFLVCALSLRNPRLGDKQSLDNAEAEHSDNSVPHLEKA